MVGDTTHDLQMALQRRLCQRGCELRVPAEPDAFAALQPPFVAHSVAQLRDWLCSHA